MLGIAIYCHAAWGEENERDSSWHAEKGRDKNESKKSPDHEPSGESQVIPETWLYSYPSGP